MFPHWYRIVLVIWLVSIPTWWIGAAFAGTTFFAPVITRPDAFPGAFLYSIFQTALLTVLFLTPLIAPFAYFAARKERSK